MKFVFYLIGILLLVSAQTAYFGYMRPFGVMPNLLLVAVLLQGLYGSASGTVALGVGGGVLLDLSSGSDFGFRTAFYILLALIVVLMRQIGLHLDSLWSSVVLTVVATIFFNAFILLATGPSQVGSHFGFIAQTVALECFLNTSMVLVIRAVFMTLSSGNRGSSGQAHKAWQ